MKILLVNNNFSNTGGADVYTYAVGNMLRDKGHEVFFFASDKQPYFEPEYKYSDFFPENVDYKNLSKTELVKQAFNPYYNFDAEKKMSDFIDLIKPDVVHCNCIFFNLTPSILRACYKKNIPVVMTLHGPQLICPSVKMMYKSKEYCKDSFCASGNPLPCIMNKCLDNSLLKSTAITAEYLFRKVHGLYGKISAYICPSVAMSKLAAKSGIPDSKLAVINNFVDEAKFKFQPDFQSGKYFLFVGRLSNEKGCHYLLEAMKRLDKSVSLHIVGTGDDEANLIKQAQDLKLDNVKFLGFLQGAELENQYRHCISTILPCNWFENFPTTIIESFVYGKPVIASNVGGITEMLENGKNGLVFEPGNVEELAFAMDTLNKDKKMSANMGKNGRMKAESSYRAEFYYSKLMNIYNNVVG